MTTNPTRRRRQGVEPEASEETSTNPFRRQTRGAEPDAGGQASTPFAQNLELPIRNMGPTLIPDPSILREVNPRVLDLNVKDLNDLAAHLAGVESQNPKVNNLTGRDLQDLEAVFYEAKIKAIQTRGQGGPPFEVRPAPGEFGVEGEVEAQWFDGWSCCCCTPCCSCAAADVDPFEGVALVES